MISGFNSHGLNAALKIKAQTAIIESRRGGCGVVVSAGEDGVGPRENVHLARTQPGDLQPRSGSATAGRRHVNDVNAADGEAKPNQVQEFNTVQRRRLRAADARTHVEYSWRSHVAPTQRKAFDVPHK